MSRPRGCIWIRGAGELASGVAWRLVRSGYRVVASEIAQPKSVRRLVCFSEAVRSGRCEVEGVPGRLVDAAEASFEPGVVTVVVDPVGDAVRGLRPDAVVDARMTKRDPGPPPCPGSPWIGLGPGFRAGSDADRVVETHRGARMGEVLRTGSAAADTGVPGVVAGESVRRLLRSPAAGHLDPGRRIGDLVAENEVVGSVSGEPVRALIAGRLRGLVHPEVELSPGEKVGDVDPRGESVDPALVSDKALAVAGGVLEALLSLGVFPGAVGADH